MGNITDKLKFLEAFVPGDLIPSYKEMMLTEEREKLDQLKFEILKPGLEPLAKLVVKPILENYLKSELTEKITHGGLLFSASAIHDWIEIINDKELTEIWEKNQMARSMGNLRDLNFF